MDCEQVRQLLDAYADGQLDADAEAQVEAHLSACSTCHAEQEALKGYQAIMAEAADVRAPAGFCEDVMQRLPKAKITWLHNTRAMVTAVAACAVIAVIGAGGVQQYTDYHTAEQQAVQSTPQPTTEMAVPAQTPEPAAMQNAARIAPAAEKQMHAPVEEFAADVSVVEENQKSYSAAMQDTAATEATADIAPGEASIPTEASMPVAEAVPEAPATETMTTFGYTSGGGGSARAQVWLQLICTYTIAEADRARAEAAVAGLETEAAVEAALDSGAIAYQKTVEYIEHTEAYAASDEAGKAEIEALCQQPEILFLYE